MAPTKSESMQRCIDECQSCHEICVETAAHCLQQRGKHAEARHIGTLLDCAEICSTCADFMLRNSQLSQRTCEVCAEACDRCAKSCDAVGDDDMMRRCTEECRRCAETCRQMAAATMQA